MWDYNPYNMKMDPQIIWIGSVWVELLQLNLGHENCGGSGLARKGLPV